MGWNLLSSAASFSKYFLNSSSVVAPISWISPLDNAGFKILDASSVPFAPPAPISVWISSMKRTILPSSVTSSITALSLFSNSPRYCVPATRDDISSERILLSLMISGTLPSAILCARPSTIAVLPTPGCPTRQGLFLLLLASTWMIRMISSSRPITGSSSPIAAISVMSFV